ncbi:hypothetical protein [Superficieibacter sp.]|uniref:hypothetical protein n=1 Tax=Superficieibacter sp. TaxID=2303322 RepID=UPI0028B1D7F8|nr:hypothetical protein [Superficieibacter sp.]
MNSGILTSIFYALLLISGVWAVLNYFNVLKKPLAVFYVLLMIFTGYAVVMEYHYHRQSITTTADVSAIRYTSSAERRMTDTCNHFRGRTNCAALYDYDLTWRVGDKTWTYHVKDKRVPPGSVMCMNVVKDKPAVAKPCENIFFNVSPLPVVIAIWAISAFIFLTLLLYRFKQRRMAVPSAVNLYRVYNTSRQLLLETEKREEALQFISRGYRIRKHVKTTEHITSGRGNNPINCMHYYVRPRKARRKMGPGASNDG